jgi:hypothetical protein
MTIQHNNSMTISASLFLMLTYCTNANADIRTFNCDFLRQHSSSEVTMALSYARHFVSESEVNKLHSHYIALKNACRFNPEAKQSINLSNEMLSLVSSR